ncbi:MAG: hypothetical protein R3C09_21685 [Pirellulaceae bacterium]
MPVFRAIIILLCWCASMQAAALADDLHHPYLLFKASEIPNFRAKVHEPGSLNRKYFDAIDVCSASVPTPPQDWQPIMEKTKGTESERALRTTRLNVIAASRCAMKYALDSKVYQKHGLAARDCILDMAKKWNASDVVNQYRAKEDGNADEHEAAQFIIYTSLAYDMLHELFTEDERKVIVNWIALGSQTAATSETQYYPEFESYPRQNHPASCILGAAIGCLAIRDEMSLLDSEQTRATLEAFLARTNANIPKYILDRGALADGRAWEGSAYGSYSLPFALLWGKMHNNIYGGNVFTGRGIEHVLEWYAHSRAAGGIAQMVEYGDDYDRYGTIAETLILFQEGNSDGYDKWLLEYLHPGGDIFKGPNKSEQAYTESTLMMALFYPHRLKTITPAEIGAQPTKYFRDFRDRSGGEVHFKNQFIQSAAGDDTVQLVLYSHRDEISKGGLAQGSLRLYAYGEKFTEEEGRAYKDTAWWGTMKHFTTLDYFNADCEHDGSLPKYEFYANRKNPGLGRMDAFIASSCASYARADGRFPLGDPSLNAAYHPNNKRYKLACSPSDDPASAHYCKPVVRADRMVLLINGEQGIEGAKPYFIVVDDYQINDVSQQYRWRWHAPRLGKGSLGEFVIEGEGSVSTPFRVYNPATDGTTLEISLLAPEQRSTEISTFAPGGGVRHQMLEVKSSGVQPVFFTILYPRKQDFQRPSIEKLSGSGDDAILARLTWGQGIEDWLFYRRGSELAAEPLQSDGRLATVRTQAEQISQYTLAEGRSLSFRDTRLVEGLDRPACVVFGNQELTITGQVKTGTFYAPQVRTVRVNDVEPQFTRAGDYVQIALLQ